MVLYLQSLKFYSRVFIVLLFERNNNHRDQKFDWGFMSVLYCQYLEMVTKKHMGINLNATRLIPASMKPKEFQFWNDER